MSKPFRLTAPEPAEREVHKSVARLLDAILLPPAMWACYPAGASILSPQQAARHIELGLKRGLPDIWIFHHGVYLIELKRRGGTLSKTRTVRTRRGSPRILEGQEDVFPKLLATGAVAAIAVCYDVPEVIRQLDKWQIPHRRAYCDGHRGGLPTDGHPRLLAQPRL
ncbi:MAG TPA: hypothetical protein VJ890_05985 [Vineibacter sp.]|nr:hypothetical protein [Vineibacter sp.]